MLLPILLLTLLEATPLEQCRIEAGAWRRSSEAWKESAAEREAETVKLRLALAASATIAASYERELRLKEESFVRELRLKEASYERDLVRVAAQRDEALASAARSWYEGPVWVAVAGVASVLAALSLTTSVLAVAQ